ncbi:uncharacterized protein DS421_16g554240 [Arachis hypogaea]|nr:uncharacterized protein DS421_16g554240 [Arachis hypogaea]
MRARRRPRVTVLEASVVTVQSCRHLIIAGCCCCACDVAASGSVTVEAGRGQKKEKRPPSPPSQTQEGEGARGRGACYRRFCRRRTPLPPLRSAAVAIAGVLVTATVQGGCRSCRQTGSTTVAVSFS